MKLQRLLLLAAAVILLTGGVISSGAWGLNWQFLDRYIKLPQLRLQNQTPNISGRVRVETEESLIIDVVDKASPAVVTVGITAKRRLGDIFEIDPFDPFAPFRRRSGGTQDYEQDIGSGFFVGSDGLLVTNKHVAGETEDKYLEIT